MKRTTDAERMSKDDIRCLVRNRRSELDPVWVRQNSLCIQRQVLDIDEFKKAQVVCCYLAMENEVRTDRIVDRCWHEGKTLCVPAFCRSSGKYRLSRLARHVPIIAGRWKIWEPARLEWMSVEKVDLMIVPGVAFDSFGGRLGHGGGHYDKIMRGGRKIRCTKVGLAFEAQMFQSVPMGKSDVPMDIVVTERRMIKAAPGAVCHERRPKCIS